MHRHAALVRAVADAEFFPKASGRMWKARLIQTCVVALCAYFVFWEWIMDPTDMLHAYGESSAYQSLAVRWVFRATPWIVVLAAASQAIVRCERLLERVALAAVSVLCLEASLGLFLVPEHPHLRFNTDKNPIGTLIDMGFDVGVKPGGGWGGLALWAVCLGTLVVLRRRRARTVRVCGSSDDENMHAGLTTS